MNYRHYIPDDPRLYEIARQVTLDAGFPWTDPRTGKTFQPRTKPKTTTRKRKYEAKKGKRKAR